MTEEIIKAFPPILPDKPHTLILGTMPGGKSLTANQYYAHPQNQFWRFMGDIYGADISYPYEERVHILKSKNIAVWDVIRACNRAGSMDSAIRNEEVNDFESLYSSFPSIELVVFDSLTAETIYNRKVIPTLSKKLTYARVPSPSPAYAKMRYAEKLAIWAEILGKKHNARSRPT